MFLWEHITLVLTVAKFECVVVSLAILICGCLVLEYITVFSHKVFAVALAMQSSIFGFIVFLTSMIVDASGC